MALMCQTKAQPSPADDPYTVDTWGRCGTRVFMVLCAHVHLRMTDFSLWVSEPDVISVISLNDFPLINLSNVSLNPREDVPAVSGSKFKGS